LACVCTARAEAGVTFDLPVLGASTFQLTSTSLFRVRGDNYDRNPFDDDFSSLYQRIDFWLQSRHLRAEARVDGFVPFVDYAIGGTPCPSGIEDDGRCYLQADLRVERLALRWRPTSAWTVEAGDAQLVFGRGVALSFRRVDLLGVDNALRGGHVRYAGRLYEARVHAGVANPQNQDPLTLAILDEPDDVVLAGSVGARSEGGTSVTLQGVRVDFADDALSVATDRAVTVGGVVVDAPALGQWSLVADAQVMRRTELLPGRPEIARTGRALYGAAQYQSDRFTFLLEMKDYSDFLVAPSVDEGQPQRIYNAPPNLEYDGPQRLRAIGNQRGFAVRTDYAFLPGPWSFTAASSFYGLNEEEAESPFDGVWVTHSWLRALRRAVYTDRGTWSLQADAGARFELLARETGGLPPGALDRWTLHGLIEWTWATGPHAWDVVVDHRHERERVIRDERRDFQVGGVNLTYSYGLPFAASLGMRWTDFQEGVIDLRQEASYNVLGGLWYPSLEVRWTFAPGTFLSFFAGQTPGGRVCSGGVCRDVPPYEGINVQFVGRI
jgi:hypothetical protein